MLGLVRPTALQISGCENPATRLEQSYEAPVICCRTEDLVAPETTVHHVVGGIRELDSQRSGHGDKYARSSSLEPMAQLTYSDA